MSGRQSGSAGQCRVSRSQQNVLINKVLDMSGGGGRGLFLRASLSLYLLSSHLSDQAAAGLSEYEVLTSW